MSVCAVILAAGQSSRFGSSKAQLRLEGKPVWRWSFERFLNHPEVGAVALMAPPDDVEQYRREAPEAAFVLAGGTTRQETSMFACEAVPSDFELVLVHDAARPFVSSAAISRVIAAARECGAAAPAIPVADTLRFQSAGGPELLDRNRVCAMQTPQGAKLELLRAAHRQASEQYTDEMELIRAIGQPFQIVDGDAHAFKLTYPEDLERALALLGSGETRSGLGYDIHAFSADPSRPLWLGGVEFPGPGLEGHSDADVVIHAIVDALLGAAALGDIGQHFPNTDPRWKGEPSATFLRHACSLLAEGGWRIINVDVAIQAEKPKIMPQAERIREGLAEVMKIEPTRVNLKATTNEGLGAIGRGEGIATFATAIIRRF